MSITKNKNSIRTKISPEIEKIPNNRLIKGKAPEGAKMSDLLKPFWESGILPRTTNEEIKKQAWGKKTGK